MTDDRVSAEELATAREVARLAAEMNEWRGRAERAEFAYQQSLVVRGRYRVLLEAWLAEMHFICDYDESVCAQHEALGERTRDLLRGRM